MSRINTPDSIAASPLQSQPLLEAVKASLGIVPNLFRIVGNSPAALEGYLGLNTAMGNGELDAPTRERIALAVAEVNGCGYCLAAHTYLGTNVARLSPGEIAANRRGTSEDAKAAIAVAFARKIVVNRGAVSDADFDAVRAAGFSDAQIVEIVGHVALNTLTNYMNEVLGTEIDFPAAEELAA